MTDLGRLAAPAVTLAFVGQSGVGKSTLINELMGAEVLPTADVGAVGKGRHATVRRELLVTPGGGLVLDTPGLRGVGLVDVDQGLDLAFPEIEALAADCRFVDCRHNVEPGCAVLAAVEDGRLPARRLESWHKLGREVRWMAARGDARARAAERQKWRLISKSVRRDGLARP
jgi:ribosome biogenesis GTPase